MKITLVRHTSLSIDPTLCYGQSDVDVSENFENERLALQEKLAKYAFDAVYASPLQRCHKLAKALCAQTSHGHHAEKIQLDARLKELNFGDWEMRKWDDIPRDAFDVWVQDYANLAPPNGETFNDLHLRATHFIEELRQHSHGKHLLVVTHGGWIRALIAEVLQMPLKGLFRISIDYASVTQLEFIGEIPKVHFVNY